MKKVKILAVAPYEGLKELITTVAEDYNEINVDVVIGDLHEGVKEVDKRISNGYDIIISRGGTAELLSKKIRYTCN